MMSTLHIDKFKSNPEVFSKDELWFHDKSLFPGKYKRVRRTLCGTELKYWYPFSQLGQRLGAVQVQEQSIAKAKLCTWLWALSTTLCTDTADTQPRSHSRLQSAAHSKTEEMVPNIQLPASAQPPDTLTRNKDIQISTYHRRVCKEKQEEKEITSLYVLNVSI